MDERRKRPRIPLQIHAKGFVNFNGQFTRVAGCVETLSQSGLNVKLTDESSLTIGKTEEKNGSLVDAEAMLTLVSYIEDNIAATGRVTHVTKNSAGTVDMGVEFNQLDKNSLSILEKILEIAPELCERPGDREKEGGAKFGSMAEFLAEITQFAILTEKAASFVIGKERYIFVGMHKTTDTNEVHVDCIESMDKPGKVYCPDCREYIDAETLM